jgi:tetratricopeptide (TPR) repeat protein
MTPELRRFLGPGRSWHDRQGDEEEERPDQSQPEPTSTPEQERTPSPQSGFKPAKVTQEDHDEENAENRQVAPPARAMLDDPNSHAIETQKIALIIGALLVLVATFYAGTKFQHLKSLVAARTEPKLREFDSNTFPAVATEELIEQAVAAEHAGKWHDAVERFVAAKQRNAGYHGLLFRAGKLCYDHGDVDNADRLLERAIASGDEADTANYFRGLIAVRHNDLSAAGHFFEEAANAKPFVPEYYYQWGEVLRRDNSPDEAVRRYEQAALRATNEDETSLYRFKARMAKAETADNSRLKVEVEQKRGEGQLSIDWLLTDAALQLRAGTIAEAGRLIGQARETDHRGLFAVYISDMLFARASQSYPEIAEACRIKVAAPSPPP